MNKVLIVESNQYWSDIFSISLKVYLELESITEETIELALLRLKSEEKDISIVITRQNLNSKKSTEEICQFIIENNLGVQLIVLGNVERNILLENNAIILPGEDEFELKIFLKTFAQINKITPKMMAQFQVPEFYPIPMKFLHFLGKSTCDLFIYLPLPESNNPYKLVIQSGQDIKIEDIKEIESFGEDYFFIKREKRLFLVNHLCQILIIKVCELEESATEKENVEVEKVIKSLYSPFEIVADKIRNLGISAATIDLVEKNMKTIATISKESKDIKALIKNLSANKAGYLFKHVQILSYLSVHLLKNLDWKSKEHENKMNYVVFFHDLFLSKDEMAFIKSPEDLKKSTLSEKDKEIVSWHANKAAEMVTKYPKIPQGVELFIMQHHGVLNGVGFTTSFNMNISPMAIAFILAEEYTDMILEAGDKPLDKNHIFSSMRDKYKTSRFRKMIDALEKIS